MVVFMTRQFYSSGPKETACIINELHEQISQTVNEITKKNVSISIQEEEGMGRQKKTRNEKIKRGNINLRKMETRKETKL